MIEQEIGLADSIRLDRVLKMLKKLGVPVKLPLNLTDNTVIDLIKHDKKAVNRWPKFVLISEIGQVYHKDGQFAVEVKPEIVNKILKKLR